ncbi:MAG: hypothetical protein HYY84_19960 [Deltaproteobacteria bacterium]|nr:hypothetical protein [Deltaproteobacteria bacterium]
MTARLKITAGWLALGIACKNDPVGTAPPVDAAATARCSGDASGPDCLFDVAAISNDATLGLALDGPIAVTSVAGVMVAEVPFRFVGAPWHSQAWSHRASLFLPDPYGDAGWNAAAVYAEVNDDDGGDRPTAFVLDLFGRETAARTRVPVAVFASAPPRPSVISTDGSVENAAVKLAHPTVAGCFDVPLDENPWKDCAWSIIDATLDWTWIPWTAIAASYLRTLHALTRLDATWRAADAGLDIAVFAPTRFATGGYSKRGIAQWYVAAMDAGVTAIWVGSGEWLSIQTMFQSMIDDWGDDGGLRASYVAFYGTPLGDQFRGVVDPIKWASRLAGVAVTPLRGSDDEIWPQNHLSTYASAFPRLVAPGFVGDAMHVQRESGEYILTSAESVGSWRGVVARLRSADAVAPFVATLDASFDLAASPIRATATATGADAGALVRVWWGSALDCTPPIGNVYDTFPAWGRDDRDMRDLSWTSLTMAKDGGVYFTDLPVGRDALPRDTQLFIDLLDSDSFASTIPLRLSDAGVDRSCP